MHLIRSILCLFYRVIPVYIYSMLYCPYFCTSSASFMPLFDISDTPRHALKPRRTLGTLCRINGPVRRPGRFDLPRPAFLRFFPSGARRYGFRLEDLLVMHQSEQQDACTTMQKMQISAPAKRPHPRPATAYQSLRIFVHCGVRRSVEVQYCTAKCTLPESMFLLFEEFGVRSWLEFRSRQSSRA